MWKDVVTVFASLCFGAFLGIAGGVAWSLHDTVNQGNNLFGHWMPALVTAGVGAILGCCTGGVVGTIGVLIRKRRG